MDTYWYVTGRNIQMAVIVTDEQVESLSTYKADEYQLPQLIHEGRYWKISVDVTAMLLTMENGRIGTSKPVIRTREVSLNKSKRDAYSQCWLEARQRYRKQKRAGSSPEQERAEPSQSATTSSQIEEMEWGSVKQEEEAPPDETDNYHHILQPTIKHPMLATKYDDRVRVKGGIKYPLRVQPKKDGIRGLIVAEGESIAIYSRTLHQIYFLDHIRDELKTILLANPGLVLDGEFFCEEGFQAITSMTLQKKERHVNEHLIVFNIFDCYSLLDPHLLYSQRRELLSSLLSSRLRHVTLIDEDVVNNVEELDLVHARHHEERHEGSMLRLDTVYEYGHKNKRSTGLIKYKFFDDSDAVIKSVTVTTSDIVFNLSMDGIDFPHRPEGTIEDKKNWADTPSLVVGRIYTFCYNGRTDKGIPKCISNGRVRFDLPTVEQ